MCRLLCCSLSLSSTEVQNGVKNAVEAHRLFFVPSSLFVQVCPGPTCLMRNSHRESARAHSSQPARVPPNVKFLCARNSCDNPLFSASCWTDTELLWCTFIRLGARDVTPICIADHRGRGGRWETHLFSGMTIFSHARSFSLSLSVDMLIY